MSENRKVLLIDDDVKLLKLLSEYLPRYGMEPLTEASPETGLKRLKEENPDLVVMDLLMPGMDGFQLCREIRKSSDIPILMLSARGESTDRIVGLELGADDYMSKPFDPRELVTRIRTILRRTERSTSGPLHFGSLSVDPVRRDASLDGSLLPLTSMEFEALLLLTQNPGRKFSRDEILQSIQGFESAGYSRSVDILISRLRSKLGENARNPRFIKSVHGFGYVFTGNAEP